MNELKRRRKPPKAAIGAFTLPTRRPDGSLILDTFESIRVKDTCSLSTSSVRLRAIVGDDLQISATLPVAAAACRVGGRDGVFIYIGQRISRA